jgi:adenosylhomocysteine nucleosidase
MILVCFAMPEEAAPFTKRVRNSNEIQVLVTGIGRENAGGAVCTTLATTKPSMVLTCGYAGGLNPVLKSGDAAFSDDAASGLRPRLLAAGAREARFHCVDHIVVTATEKRLLREATAADAVEMESGVIREICREQGVPAATVRVISDAAGEDLPLDFNRLMTADRKMDYARLAGAILKSPGRIPALLRLQSQTRRAGEELARVLAEVLQP